MTGRLRHDARLEQPLGFDACGRDLFHQAFHRKIRDIIGITRENSVSENEPLARSEHDIACEPRIKSVFWQTHQAAVLDNHSFEPCESAIFQVKSWYFMTFVALEIYCI